MFGSHKFDLKSQTSDYLFNLLSGVRGNTVDVLNSDGIVETKLSFGTLKICLHSEAPI